MNINMIIVFTTSFSASVTLFYALWKIKAKHDFMKMRKDHAENKLKEAEKSFEYEIGCYERENKRLQNLLEICYKSKHQNINETE